MRLQREVLRSARSDCNIGPAIFPAARARFKPSSRSHAARAPWNWADQPHPHAPGSALIPAHVILAQVGVPTRSVELG